MRSSIPPEARGSQEPCASERLVEQHGDRKPVDRPSVAHVDEEGSAEDEGWADLAASARADWAANNPF